MHVKFIIPIIMFFLLTIFVNAAGGGSITNNNSYIYPSTYNITTLCYQESATVYNQMGIDNPCAMYTGSYSLISFEPYINYTKPISATSNSMWSISMVNYTNGVNISIPLSCWNYDVNTLNLRFGSFRERTSGYNYSADCYNGTTWINMMIINRTTDNYGSCVQGCPAADSTVHSRIMDGNWTTGASQPQCCNNWGSVVSGDDAIYEEAMLWDASPYFKQYTTSDSTQSLGNVFRILSNTTQTAPFVNYSVTLPNGSVVLYNSTYIDGYWTSQNLTAVNGTYIIKAYSNSSFFNQTWNITVYDNQTVNPKSFANIKSKGENFTFSTTINTYSIANLSYNVSCATSSVNISCNILPFYIMNSSDMNITFNTSANISNGNYTAQINITRLLDGRVDTLNFNLTILATFGVPRIVNMTGWMLLGYNNQQYTNTYLLENNGTYNLTNCTGSLDSSFLGWTFYSFVVSDAVIPVNGIANFTVIMNNIPAGAYSGHLQIDCIATQDGVHNSLESLNQPFFTISSSSPPAAPPSGGGGTPYIPPVSSGNTNSTFTLETDAGGSSFGLYFYPGQSRDFSLILSNLITTDQDVSIKCKGDFCSNVVLSKTSIELTGKAFQVILMNVKMPADTPYNKQFAFSIIAEDSASNTRSLDVQIETKPVANFVNKFALNVKPGDEGYLISIGSFNVPKILFYLLIIGVFEAILAWVIPNKGPGGRNPQALWMPILGIIVGVAVILLI